MNTTVIRKRRIPIPKGISKGIAKICSHNIEWHLEGKGHRLWDVDIEHIQNMLIKNFIAGKLCSTGSDGEKVRGWWSIQI
jgi:hypothetical protein